MRGVPMASRSAFAPSGECDNIRWFGKDYYESEEHVIGFLNAGGRAKIFGKYGAFWGGLIGVLFGSALMFVPILGHIIVLGPLAAMLVRPFPAGGAGLPGIWSQRLARAKTI